MRISLRLLTFLLVFSAIFVTLTPASAQVYSGHPKLIVVVVIDQFRGDYLNRDRDQFKGRGFRLFMDQGAWFTDCYYDYANTKTGPGHATIGTGSYTDGHGIDSNEWWDAARSFTQKVGVVEDERYQLVDVPASVIPANQPNAPSDAAKFLVGASPLNLRASTLGDELRLATQGRARVYGISLKDRASILPAGQSANAAYFIEPSTGQFTTSTYYMEHLPEWAAAFNASGRRQQAAKEANAPEDTNKFYNLVGRSPAANRYELAFAKALITGEKLGANGVTDELIVSLSPNDIQGHAYGPDSDSQQQMILALDRDLDNFFTWLDKNVGLNNVWLALTGDHGIAPMTVEAAKLGIHAATLNLRKLYEALNTELNKRHSPGQNLNYLLPGPELPYITLDKRVYEKLGIDEQKAEDEVADLLPALVAAQDVNAPPVINGKSVAVQPAQQRLAPGPRVDYTYTRVQMATGQLPPTERGRLIGHSYMSHGNWFVMVELDAYQYDAFGSTPSTTHTTSWNYDRHVPLAFYGEPFKVGEYHNLVAPVDMAVTLASLAGVNKPSAAVGRVLTEAIMPGAFRPASAAASSAKQ